MLKRISTVLLFAAVSIFAADAPDGVPKGATETAPGVYRFVDKDGKAWVYRKTPFGMSKRAEVEASAAPAAKEGSASGERSRMTPFGETKDRSAYVDAIEGTAARNSNATAPSPVQTKVYEDGDSLRFERPSPFGSYKWTRKKDELNADERRIWEAQRSAAAAGTEKK